MRIVNRTVIIVKPKKPYLDWANSIDDFQVTLEELHAEPTAFLVSQYAMDEQKNEILRRHFEEIFEYELIAWSLDKATWPQSRDLKMFKEWFEVSFHSMALDLLPEPIEREDFEGGWDEQ